MLKGNMRCFETGSPDSINSFLLAPTIHELYQSCRNPVWQIEDHNLHHHPNPSMFGGTLIIKKPTQGLPLNRFHQARGLFKKLLSSIEQLNPSSLDQSEIDENLAIAFLKAPERLVWADQTSSRLPSYLGHKIDKCQSDGYFVAAVLLKSPFELFCILELPCTHMQFMEAASCRSWYSHRHTINERLLFWKC